MARAAESAAALLPRMSRRFSGADPLSGIYA
jgi:hypothetical protein